ncbi:unnamed protein product [Paramecium octaurelia]|uniref:Major facilitator superfamily (MFS) profile domain-containing protein n=1 Tax=Paramecium octaurelia TaxID=43137 RepID=A0A8S1T3C5_PAROT|nr:unnamed protein product [Paramecium octaurelia]
MAKAATEYSDYDISDDSLGRINRNKIDKPLICFCVLNFFLNAAVSVIAPFYPPLAKEKAHVSVSTIGYIFGLNPIGAFFFSLVMGKKMSHWGRRRCMLLGLVIQSAVVVAFGLLDFMTFNKELFVTVSCVTRFLQGASRAAYSSISFAYIPILWPDSIQKKISILETLTGLGLMSGPFIGAALDALFGYQMIFYVLGGIFFLALIPTAIFLPEDDHSINKKPQLNSKRVIRNRQIWSLGLLLTMMSAGTTFINPIFSIHMKCYNMEEDVASLLLGWLTISYIICINIVPKLLQCIDKKVILTFGLFCSCIGDLIIAPLGIFPNKWFMTMIGLPFIGVANAFCVLPAIPQFIDYLNQLFNSDPSLRLPISDLSSGLFISFYSLGTFVGPVIGGIVYDAFLVNSSNEAQLDSFQRSSYTMAGLQAIVSILFIFGGDVYAQKYKRIRQGENMGISLEEEDEYEGSNKIGVQMFSSTQPNVSHDESS